MRWSQILHRLSPVRRGRSPSDPSGKVAGSPSSQQHPDGTPVGPFRAVYRGVVNRWLSWGRWRRVLALLGGLFTILVIVFGALLGTGISAALDARRAADQLQDEMRSLTPLDLIQVTVHESLRAHFQEVEASTSKARSRLAFLGGFQWVPFLGDEIEERRLLLDMGFSLSRAGGNLSDIYRSALESPAGQLEPDEASAQVADFIRNASPRLDQVQADLARLEELRHRLEEFDSSGRYISLVDRYLPVIQAATHVSRASPEAIGDAYSVQLGLDDLRVWVDDPLEVLADPARVGASLSDVSQGAAKLQSSLSVIRQSAEQSGLQQVGDQEAVLDMLLLMEQGAIILQHTTAGARGLAEVATAIETDGFLSPEFGARAGPSLEEALDELELARLEVDSFQQLLSLRGLEVGQILGTSSGEGSTVRSSDLEIMLEDISDATRFFVTFLGYEGSRTYLLLGQNQNEIRATGGFIGVAVELALDEGELVTITYHDSTLVDSLPLEDNPFPPDPLYWYLWMGRLLFRDANWDPHFPTAAAKVAELYYDGQGVRVDGVIAGTKNMALELTDVFGDITVPEVEGPLTRERAELYTEGDLPYPCRERHTSYRGKRCFDEDLFFALRDRSTGSMPGEVKREVVDLIRSNLNSKTLLIHILDAQEAGFVWERGWNGAIPAVDHDFLMVVDSSLPGHSAAQVQRTLEYRVSLETGQRATANVRIRYDHGGQAKDLVCRQGQPLEYDCFWNYFRLYLSPLATEIRMPEVPLHEGSERLIWGYPETDSASLSTAVRLGSNQVPELGGYIAVEPGSVTTVPVSYELKPEVLRPTAEDAYEYRLLIQKQPGLDRDQVRVAVDLPRNADLLSTSIAPTARRGQTLLFDFTLAEDTLIAVSFRTS